VANTTGVETSTKRMQMLKEIASSGRRLAWLIPGYGLQSAEGKQIDLTPYEKEAHRLGLEVKFYFIAKGEDINAVFRDIAANKADMLSVGSSPLMIREQGRIVALANAHRLPSAFLEPSFVAAGGLLSFGPDRLDARRKTAEYVDRILKGGNPATMPVEQPQRFSIAINLRTARALGLTIPASIRLGADLVVE
jgi:putative ABC transport system substrate-binding protein